ncbi:MAG: methionine aminotransferase [Owenweeksia sp.]|nr:methionine aminotransferase [Owenweeksia sp.]
MSALAAEHNALNLSQGFPDFPADPALIASVHQFMQKGYNQYSPLAGVAPLRQVLSETMAQRHGHQYDVHDEITITHGATQAIAAAIGCAVREGDEVIIFTPAYDCYAPQVELNGGVPIYVQLQHPEYSIDWDTVKNRINHRTRMIIINTPHNPSSKLLKKADLEKLKEITAGSEIFILADEVYEEIAFAPQKHHSVADYPELVERSFRIGSLGKVLHVTGWKTGYCMAPAALTAEFRKVHQYMIFSANTPIQLGMAEYLSNPQRPSIASLFKEKRDQFLEGVAQSGFKPLPSEGSYFQLLDYSELSDEADTEFAKRLTVEHGIASIPLSVFYHQPKDHKVLRFCFAKDDQTLKKAGEILTGIG